MAPKAGKASLDAKMLSFREMLKRDNITAPDMRLVQSFFSTNELKALWGRLATARGKADVSVQEAWNELAGDTKAQKGQIHVAKDEVQNKLLQNTFISNQMFWFLLVLLYFVCFFGFVPQALISFVAFPESWQQRALKAIRKVSVSKTATVTATPLTRGQLEAQHGEVEAAMLIAEGEVVEIQKKGSKIPRYIRIDQVESIKADDQHDLVTERTACIHLFSGLGWFLLSLLEAVLVCIVLCLFCVW